MSAAETKYQRRHYREIAGILQTIRGLAISSGNLYMLDAADTTETLIAEAFERDNPRFDRGRFLAACKPTGTANDRHGNTAGR